MLRTAIAFFVIALLAYFLGANGFAGLSMEIGRALLFVFLALAALSFVWSVLTSGKPKRLP